MAWVEQLSACDGEGDEAAGLGFAPRTGSCGASEVKFCNVRVGLGVDGIEPRLGCNWDFRGGVLRYNEALERVGACVEGWGFL